MGKKDEEREKRTFHLASIVSKRHSNDAGQAGRKDEKRGRFVYLRG